MNKTYRMTNPRFVNDDPSELSILVTRFAISIFFKADVTSVEAFFPMIQANLATIASNWAT